MNPAPGFWPIFGPPGPPGGPGSPGTGPGSKSSAGCAKNQTPRPILSPIRGYLLRFWDRPQKDKKINQKLGRTYGQILDFSFGALKSVSRVNLR